MTNKKETTAPTELEKLKAKKSEIIKGFKASLKFLTDESNKQLLIESASRQLADIILQIAIQTGELE